MPGSWKTQRWGMNQAVFGLGACFFLFYFAILLLKYYALAYFDWDLAFFSQAAWNLLRGEQYTSLVGINYFGDHGYFITFLVLPFFFIFPSPITLLVLKPLALVIAAGLLYRLVAERLGERWGAAFFVLYLVFPANVFGLLYEFNPDALAPPIIFWIFTAIRRTRLAHFLIATTALMLVKENLCLMAFVFSLLAVFRFGKSERMALVLYSVFCLLFFYYIAVMLVPALRGLDHHSFTVRYPGLGSSTLEVILSPILNPAAVARILFTSQNMEFLAQLFGYTLLPALLSPLAILPAVPLLLQHMVSSYLPEKTIYYHYGLALAPFLFMAMAATLQWVLSFSSSLRRFSGWVMAALLILGVVSILRYGSSLDRALDVDSIEGMSNRWDLIRAIPPGEGVVATFDFLAPLSTRKELYSFHKIYDDRFQDPDHMRRSELYIGTTFRLPDTVNYALLDMDDRWLNSALETQDQAGKRIEAFLAQPSWKLLRKEGNVLLLKRSLGLD